MGNLGGFFPEKIRKKLADYNLEIGSVIKCFTNHTKPPKEKRLVVLGSNEEGDVCTVFINTNVNFNVINSQELLDQQYLVKNETNDYLDHDSFIDCSDLFEFEKETLLNMLISEPERSLGKVSDEDLSNIMALVKNSPIIEPILLKKYNFK